MADENQIPATITENKLLTYEPQNFGGEDPLSKIKESIIKKAESSVLDNRSAFDAPITGLQSNDHRVSFKEYNVPLEAIYAPVGDKYVARFDNYIYGTDNNERLAREQDTSDKWANGLKKAGVNLLTTAAGSTIGFGTSLVNWVSEGFDAQAYYTDDFNTWLDEVNQELNYKLPNYYSAQEQNMNLWESMGTANFWANDVAKGISFTLGAVVGEGIWAAVTGGASLSTTAARLGLRGTQAAKVVRGINQWQKLGKKMMRAGFSTKTARNLARTAEVVNTTRFTMSSAGYEAGVEARQLMMEARQNFETNFQQQYGRPPTAQEKAEFEDRLTTAANAAFAGNLALVGASNLAIFGKMFNITNPLIRSGKSLRQGINRSLFGIGTEATTTGKKFARTALKPTRGQKILGYTTSFAKAPIIEGSWEEGQQSVISNSANNWLESGYDIDATKDSYGLMEGIYEGYAETYGSKEGWKEIGIGMIVGLVGGGVSGQFTSYRNAVRNEQSYADAINNEHIGAQILADKFLAQNQIFKANKDEVEAQQQGDFVGQQQARERAILSAVRVHKKYDRLDQSFEDFKTAINIADSQEIAEQNNIEVEDVEAYKEAVIEEYKTLQDRFSNNRDFAGYIVGSGTTTSDLEALDIKGADGETVNKQWVADAIAYNLTMGENAGETSQLLMESIQAEIASIVGATKAAEFNTALKVKNALEKTTKEKRDAYWAAKKKNNDARAKVEALKNDVLDAQKVLERTQDQERKQELSANLLELSSQLETANEQLLESKREWELAAQALEIKSPLEADSEYISADQLDEIAQLDAKGQIIGGRLFEIDQLINSLAQSDPKKYARFKKLFHEYQKSVYAFREYNKTVQGISSENFSPANFNTKLEQIIGKNKNANEFTREFFANIGDQMWFNFIGGELNAEQQQTTAEEAAPTPTDTGDTMDQNPQRETSTTTRTPIQQLQDLINKALKKNSLISTYIGEDIASAQANRPTQSELDEYLNLHNKIDAGQFRNKQSILMRSPEQLKEEQGENLNLTEEEIARFQELNAKLSNWQVSEGTLVDGTNSTLADLIIRLQQLQMSPETNNTKEEVTVADTIRITSASEKNSSATRTNKNMVQTPQGVYLRITPTNNFISHMTVETLWGHIQGATTNITYKKGKKNPVSVNRENLQKVQKEEGNIFYIGLADGTNVEFTIGTGARLVFTKSQWAKIEPLLNIKFVTAEGVTPAGNSIIGYGVREDGSTYQLQSDFTIETTSNSKPYQMTPTELMGVETLETFVDPQNTHNKKLLDNLNRARKSKNEKAIRKAETALKTGVVVYLMSGGKIAGTLRAQDINNTSKDEGSINFDILRSRAAQQLEAAATENLINLQTTIPISNKYKGSPIFRLRVENGEVVMDSQPITEKELSLITDAGYVQNGNLVTGNKVTKEDIDTTYLPKTAEKTPIVVFNYNGSPVAFPVSLVGQPVDLQSQLQEILNFQNISDGERINRINEFLLQNGIAPSEYNLEERDLYYTNKLDVINERLGAHVVYPSVENWAKSGYNLSNLRTQAQISIDITNKPFNTPKLVMNLAGAQIAPNTMKATNTELKDREVELVNRLYESVMEMPTPHNMPDNKFTELWDEVTGEGVTNNYSVRKNRIPNMVALSKTLNLKSVKSFYEPTLLANIKNTANELERVQSKIEGIATEINQNLKQEVEKKKKEACTP